MLYHFITEYRRILIKLEYETFRMHRVYVETILLFYLIANLTCCIPHSLEIRLT